MAIATFLSPAVCLANNEIKEQKALWGFRCTSDETKTVTTIALQNGKVISITVHPEVDGQINFARTSSLKEIGQNRYSGEYAATPQEADEDQNQQIPQNMNYEMSFSLEDNHDEANSDSAPKIQQASLKENGIAQANLNCSPVFQTRTRPATLL